MNKVESNQDKQTKSSQNKQIVSNQDKQTASERKYGIHPDMDFDLCNVASSTDLTGLIQAAVYSKKEEKSYGDLYEYQAQDIMIPKSEDHRIV